MSAPYLRLKNIQGTTIGNIWKNFFFKKAFGEKNSPNGEKPKKRSFMLIKRFFTNLKLQKNARGKKLIKLKIFEKSRLVSEKNSKGDPFASPVLLEAEKNYGLVRESNPRSSGSEKWSQLNK